MIDPRPRVREITRITSGYLLGLHNGSKYVGYIETDLELNYKSSKVYYKMYDDDWFKPKEYLEKNKSKFRLRAIT